MPRSAREAATRSALEWPSELPVGAEMIPSDVEPAMVAVRPVQASRDEIIVQDAYAKMDTNIYGHSLWRAISAAATMELDEIHRE